MKKLLTFTAILLAFFLKIPAQNKPSIERIDRIRIAEAFRIGEKLQNKVWNNWGKAPFSLLLIADENEFLIRHPKPSEEFQSIGYDKLLKSEIFFRPRKFQKNFLATFPAFGTPLIIVGKAENTYVKTSTAWVFTILHEHFHQMQMSQTDYFTGVKALNLSRGDETGMWQLNYPFPYENQVVATEFKKLSELLSETFKTSSKRNRSAKLDNYLRARRNFAKMLNEDDYKYFSFQLWQEGIARYTQYKVMELAARKLKPGKEFRKLKDFTSFQKEAEKLLADTLNEMKNIDISQSQRIVFYPFGALEGLLLDKTKPDWQTDYFTRKFALEDYYPKTK